MGTRSMIAIQNPYNKTVRAVYCHWDGYLEHNGSILNKHYSNSAKVNNLIALGGLSSLRAEIGDKHLFNSIELPKDQRAAHEEAVKDMCTFYGRDRGETGQEFKVFPTLKEAEDYFAGSWCEYLYVFKYSKADDYQSGEWHYKTIGGRWLKLAPALKRCDQKDLA
jgi:hypothetical protein